jgi:16S rRNA (cytidine1402-2'-O)-methyltransferase
MPLVVAGVPIGNVADAAPRLVTLLSTADLIAAEDTRRLRRLARELGVRLQAPVISCFDANEPRRAAEIAAALADGSTVALVTDAGMPSVSDPGARVVAAAVAAGAAVTVVPGPSALTSALAVSGLPAERVAFEGFLPRTPGQRRRRAAELGGETRTLVFYEAPHRIAACLADLAAALGADRPAVLCREMTKTYEEILRGTLGELAALAAERELRGELTLVVAAAPAAAPVAPPDDTLAREVALAQDDGLSRGAATTAVAQRHGLARRVVFDALVRAKAKSRG